jgi:redox-regulated HSP33 family molecular chaperone
MFNIFNIFKRKRKKLSQAFLYKQMLKNHKKVWDNRLDQLIQHVAKISKNGLGDFLIKQEILKCEYNETRSQSEILKDIKNIFPDCDCYYENSVMGQLNIIVSWRKK